MSRTHLYVPLSRTSSSTRPFSSVVSGSALNFSPARKMSTLAPAIATSVLFSLTVAIKVAVSQEGKVMFVVMCREQESHERTLQLRSPVGLGRGGM